MEVVCGPMFAGKSTEMVRRYERACRARKRVLVLRHATDTRPFARHGDSPSEQTLGLPVATPAGIEAAAFRHQDLGDGTADACKVPVGQVLLLEEVQFFPPETAQELLEALARVEAAGCAVTCFGLDLDASGRPFGVMPELLAAAEHVTKLKAVCGGCGADATRTQRLVAGTTVGGAEAYGASCRACWHAVP